MPAMTGHHDYRNSLENYKLANSFNQTLSACMLIVLIGKMYEIYNYQNALFIQ